MRHARALWAKRGWFSVPFIVPLLLLFPYVWLVGLCDGPPEPAPAPTATAVPVIVPPGELTLLLTPTPAPTPSPTPAPPDSNPIPLPSPEALQPALIRILSPLARDIDYEDWWPVELAFPEAEEYRALRTAWCESGFDDDAIGEAGEVGRWQIHPIWFDDDEVRAIIEDWFPGATQSTSGIVAALKHVHVNAEVAAGIQRREGWGPWTTRYGCPGWQG